MSSGVDLLKYVIIDAIVYILQEFSESDYDAIVDGWKDKQVRCGQGDQRWGLFYAEKPHVAS